MSDVAQSNAVAPAAPSTPVEATVPQAEAATAPATTPQAPTSNEPFSRKKFIDKLFADADQPPATTPVEQKLDATGRVHGPDGKFVSATEPQAASTPPAEKQSTPATTPETERITIADPEIRRLVGNLDTIDVPKNLSQFVRTALNSWTRRAEAETNLQRAIQAEARLRAVTESRDNIVANPQITEDIRQLRELGRDDLADAVLAGLRQKESEKVSEYTKASEQEVEQHVARARLEEWSSDALHRSRSRYPQWYTNRPEFEQVFRKAGFLYANAIDFEERSTGQAVEPTTDGLWKHLDQLFMSDEFTRTTHATLKAQKNAQSEAERRAAEEAKRLAEAQTRHNTLPPAVPNVSNNLTTPRPDEFAGLSGDKKKRAIRDFYTASVAR